MHRLKFYGTTTLSLDSCYCACRECMSLYLKLSGDFTITKNLYQML